MGLGAQLSHAWNAFFDVKPAESNPFGPSVGMGSSAMNQSRARMAMANERTTVASIYTRIAIDTSGAVLRHVRLDEDDRFLNVVRSGLNNCLTLEPNLDQAGRAFRRDLASTIISQGVAAVVPVQTSLNPQMSGSYDILSLRVGHIVAWYPKHVKISLYNEDTGMRQEVTLEKRVVAIIENPLYDVMNEPNSTLQRLIRKLSILDAIDEQAGSGKLDLIIQLPYAVKTDTKREQAVKRREELEFQLRGSQYGIAYTDGTEKITQLNRPAENNLMAQVEYLTKKLYTELGLTEEVMNGTADESAMLNYNDRTINPILDAIIEEMTRKFLTKTARTQGQAVQYFRDPFKYVPISQMADIADKFGRNEITSSNEIRQGIGLRPSKDPKADELRNSNMPEPVAGPPSLTPASEAPTPAPDPNSGG
jgi:uncharacterized membrane protein YidH (DUF202 family)